MLASRPERNALREGHLAAWALERLAYEPDGVDPAALAHGEACGACRGDVERLLRERDAFLARRPVRPFIASVAARAERDAGERRPGWQAARRWILAGGAAFAAATLVLALRAPGPPAEVRYKGNGGTVLSVFVSRGGEPARPLLPGDVLRSGDVVRFGIVSPAAGHAMIASVDEQGRVSRYYPRQGTGTAPVEGRAAQQILPGSIVLDETPGREWIVLVVSRVPLAGGAVEEALQRAWRGRRGTDLGPLALDAGTSVVALRKAAP